MTLYQSQALADFRLAARADLESAGCRVLVFGSAARGRAFPFSDVDVAVISKRFAGLPWMDRIAKLKALLPAASPVSPIGVTEADLQLGAEELSVGPT